MEIVDRAGLAAFIAELRADISKHPDTWENGTIDGYLEAVQAWLKEADGLRANAGLDVDSMSSWQLAASMLYAGKIFE